MYYRVGRTDAFQKILTEALKDEGFDQRIQKRHLFENEKQRIKAMNALAGHQLNLVEAEQDPEQRRQHFELGFKLIEEANMMSRFAPDNLVSMCFYNIAKGQLKDAIYACQTCEQQFKHEQQPSELSGLCLLLKAIIDFNKGNYRECLSQVRQIIWENPKAPSDLWFVLGLCYYRVNNIPKARLSFEKTLELDPKNAMALTSLGIIEIVTNATNFESRKRAVNYFVKAFDANPRNPLVLKYLAEHLFFKGEFE